MTLGLDLAALRAAVTVITTYEPDSIHFEEDFRTRKKL